MLWEAICPEVLSQLETAQPLALSVNSLLSRPPPS